MTKRPTIALASILKNEEKNLPRFLDSVKGCFDAIHLTDTGSTDGSLAVIEKYQRDPEYGTEIHLHTFQWCDDFAAARNASFAPAKTDYVMWLDLDDVLSDRAAFIQWRNTVMKLADFWIATYHYAFDKAGKPNCSFARERVFRRSLDLQWRYFVHEGIVPSSPKKKQLDVQYAQVWTVNHLRDEEDLKADRSRNLKLFASRLPSLDARMRYYYGKELFENDKPLEAFGELMAAVSSEQMELHDRVMSLQYACLASMRLNQLEKAIQLAHQGLQLAPQRAEFFIVLGDSYTKLNRITDALPFYQAASRCAYASGAIQGPVFSHEDSYKHYPLNQSARIYVHQGDIDAADRTIAQAKALGPHAETEGIEAELKALRERLGQGETAKREVTEDIVISCHPTGLYEWDEGVYRDRGIGGSETAAVEMARWMSDLSGRKVLVFNNRTTTKVFGRVEYRPASELPKYFAQRKPAAHIAWRHAVKFSDDPMHVWCHDLSAPGIEKHENFDKVFALSPFHKDFLQSMCGVPESKIWVTSNGIEPTRFTARKEKAYGKVVFSSSPDRGLERALRVMDIVVKGIPEAALHVFYGFDNMLKLQKHEEVARLQALVNARPYVVMHGNLPQEKLTRELEDACLWLYPTNFLETFCITAIEMLCSGVYPVARSWGALTNTLGPAAREGMATLLDLDCETEEEVAEWAAVVTGNMLNHSWKNVIVNPADYSWRAVAEKWLKFLGVTDAGELRPLRCG